MVAAHHRDPQPAPARARRGLYVRVYDSLPEHRKTLRAAGVLEVPVELLIGHLVRLWLWLLHNADASGLVDGGTCKELALAARWVGRPEDFEAALTLVGFIERTDAGFVVHGWDEASGRIHSEREAERNRWQKRQRRDWTPDGASPSGHSSSTPPEYGGEGGAYSGGDSTGVPPEPPPELQLSAVQLKDSTRHPASQGDGAAPVTMEAHTELRLTRQRQTPARKVAGVAAELVEHYKAEVVRTRGITPVFKFGEAAVVFARLADAHGGERIRTLITEFLEHPPDFFAERNLFLPHHIMSASNELLGARKRGRGTRSGANVHIKGQSDYRELDERAEV